MGGNPNCLLIALCVLLIPACGGSDSGEEAAPAALPGCAKPAKTIPRPKALPASLPVPGGTVFTQVEEPFAGQSVVSGVSPGNLENARSFYDDTLEDAGYRQGLGESESGEVEALFTGRGVRGGWRANAIPGCEGAVRLTLVVVRT